MTSNPNFEERKDCLKVSGHSNYKTAKAFSVEYLPEEFQNERNQRLAQYRIDQTVKIKVNYTSKDRPDRFPNSDKPYPFISDKGKLKTRLGTGTILHCVSFKPLHGLKCSCPDCLENHDSSRGMFMIYVRTATHVVCNGEEARQSEFEVFYDSDDCETKTLYGFDIEETFDNNRYESDVNVILCSTHDSDTFSRITDMLYDTPPDCGLNYVYPPPYMIVSHPHGWSKQISIGTVLYLNIPVEPFYKTGKFFPFPQDTIYFLKPDIEFPLGMHFKLPEGAQYAFRYHREGEKLTMSFPADTTFATIQSTTVRFPDDTKFINNNIDLERLVLDYNSSIEPCLIMPLEPERGTLEWVPFPPDTHEYKTSDNVYHQLCAGMMFKLPADAKYAFQYTLDRQDFTISFPRGTQFVQNKTKALDLPDDVLFINTTLKPQRCFLTYDMQTCPGSSGAAVYCDYLDIPNVTLFSHGGTFSESLGASGMFTKDTPEK